MTVTIPLQLIWFCLGWLASWAVLAAMLWDYNRRKRDGD